MEEPQQQDRGRYYRINSEPICQRGLSRYRPRTSGDGGGGDRTGRCTSVSLFGTSPGELPRTPAGACCLIGGRDKNGRPIHVVRTTANPLLIVITVYTPKPPEWPTPEE